MGVSAAALPKAPTGIKGLDDITEGGLPLGRPTLICGGAGSGKTLFGLEFLVRGARDLGEPGVMMAFEETGDELAQNVASLGFDLDDLVARHLLVIDQVEVDRSHAGETGEFTLEGLFVRLGYAIDSIGARRVVLDSLETLFAGLADAATLRSELARLFRWLKDRGVTAVITGERGQGTITRHGLEEYVSDCVIVLDNRVRDQFATRRLRILKYRGSHHGTDEFPFLIRKDGLSVLPMTSVGLNHTASTERISSGIGRLDVMLGGDGYYRGSSVLVSGTAGTGKTSLAAHLADATCRRGERCLVFMFEESSSQLIRNMRSIGVDLAPWVESGMLRLVAARPSVYGVESHLVTMQQAVEDFAPSVVVLDPITNFTSVGTPAEARALLTRLIDLLKERGITTLFTSLTHGVVGEETSDVGISSLMDTWLLVRELESGGERNQVREFRLTTSGIDLVDVYTGQDGVLTGSARQAQEARERADEVQRREAVDRRARELERRRKTLEGQLEAIRLELAATDEEAARLGAAERAFDDVRATERAAMAVTRRADEDGAAA